MKQTNIPEEMVQMKAFPFSLCDAVKTWLFSQPKPIARWEEMKGKFLQKVFPTSKATSIRKETSGISITRRKPLRVLGTI